MLSGRSALGWQSMQRAPYKCQVQKGRSQESILIQADRVNCHIVIDAWNIRFLTKSRVHVYFYHRLKPQEQSRQSKLTARVTPWKIQTANMQRAATHTGSDTRNIAVNLAITWYNETFTTTPLWLYWQLDRLEAGTSLHRRDFSRCSIWITRLKSTIPSSFSTVFLDKQRVSWNAIYRLVNNNPSCISWCFRYERFNKYPDHSSHCYYLRSKPGFSSSSSARDLV